MIVYVLSHVVEYESSRVLGVFSSFDAALAEARRYNKEAGHPWLLERSQYGDGIYYEPFRDNSYFYEILEKEVKGERNDN